MSPTQLREWLFLNSQEDQWLISLDSDTDHCPVTLKEIEEKLRLDQFAQIQVLHLTQAKLSHPPWIEVALSKPIETQISSTKPRGAPLTAPVPVGSTTVVYSQPQQRGPSQPLKNPGVAAVLSFLVPGLGQIYNGEILSGLIFAILTIVLYFIFIGFLLHIYVIYDAYNYATKLNKLNN